MLYDLECKTLKDITRFGRKDLLVQSGINRSALSEIVDVLTAHGFELAEGPLHPPPSVPESPELTWGCLHVHRPHDVATQKDVKEAEDEVRRAVTAVYAAAGFQPKEGAEWLADADEGEDAEAGERTQLDEDDVVVQAESCGWVAVASYRLELGPVGAHPLALALSSHFPVLSVASRSDRYTEVSLYRDGKLAQIDVRGPEVPRIPPAAPLDLAWLGGVGNIDPKFLGAMLGASDLFGNLIGLSLTGLRDAMDRGAVNGEKMLEFRRS